MFPLSAQTHDNMKTVLFSQVCSCTYLLHMTVRPSTRPTYGAAICFPTPSTHAAVIDLI